MLADVVCVAATEPADPAEARSSDGTFAPPFPASIHGSFAISYVQRQRRNVHVDQDSS